MRRIVILDIKLILSGIFIPAIFALIFCLIKKSKDKLSKRMTDQNFAVFIPGIVAIIGATLSGMCIIILICFSFFSEETPHIIFYLAFGMFLWLGLYLIIKTLCFRVIVKKQIITVYPLFGKQFTFSFREITSVLRQVKQNQLKSERMVIRIESGKKFIVESSEISYFRFMKRLKAEVPASFLHGFE